MNTSGLLQSKSAPLTLQETRCIHDSMNILKIEFLFFYHAKNLYFFIYLLPKTELTFAV